MTRPWLLGAVLAASLAAPAAAQAADQTITVGTGDQRVVCTTNCATVSPGTPANVVVNIGETVTWTYAADRQQKHHIQSDLQTGSPEIWDFSPGVDPTTGSFPHPFNSAGSFGYHCAPAPIGHARDGHGQHRADGGADVVDRRARQRGERDVRRRRLVGHRRHDRAHYEWDLDGNGTYETLGATTPDDRARLHDRGHRDGAACASPTATARSRRRRPRCRSQQRPARSRQPQPPSRSRSPSPHAAAAAAARGPGPRAGPGPRPADRRADRARRRAAPRARAPRRSRRPRASTSSASGACGSLSPARPAATLVLNGTVKVGARKLKLKKVTRSLGAGTVGDADAAGRRRQGPEEGQGQGHGDDHRGRHRRRAGEHEARLRQPHELTS